MDVKHNTLEKRICAVLIALLVLSLVPIVMISFYAYPSADDYTIGMDVMRTLSEGGTALDAIRCALAETMQYYENWMGNFSSIFMASLRPLISGNSFYYMCPFILLSALLIGTLLFVYTVCKRILRCSTTSALIVTLTITFVTLQFTYYPAEAFFWYNGGIHYTFMYGVSLVFFSVVVLTHTVKNRIGQIVFFVLSLPLAFVVGGANYTTALTSSIVLFLMIVLMFLMKRAKTAVLLSVPFLTLMIAFALNVFSPGTLARQDAVGAPNSPVKAIILSLFYGAYTICSSASFPVVIAWLFLTPFLYSAAKKLPYRFPLPGVVLLLSYGVFSAQATPNIYAVGIYLPERMINIIYFSFQLLVLFDLTYLLGWLSHQSWWNEITADLKKLNRRPKWGVLCIAALFAFGFASAGLVKFPNRAVQKRTGLPLSLEASVSLLQGEAQQFYKQMKEREEIYLDESIRDVRVEPLRESPYLLVRTDISDDPESLANLVIQKYYGKDSVLLIEED